MGNSTFTAKSTEGSTRFRSVLSFLVIALVMTLGLPVAASAGPGSEDCQSATGTEYEFLLKVDPPPDQTTDYPVTLDGEPETITVKVGEDDFKDENGKQELVSFDFEATGSFVFAVFVKSGTGSSQLFEYPEGTDSDEGLTAKDNKAISHITFCGRPPTFALDLLKVDADDDSVTLAGAGFDLYLDDGDTAGEVDDGDSFVDDCTTDNDGECTFTDLAAGDYLLVETDAPEGYEATSDGPIGVTIADADEEVTVENDAVVETPETFALNLLKVDEGNASNVLAGAQFSLFSDDGATSGALDDADTFESACTTGSDGECEFEGLDAGDYLLVETRAPEGFVAVSDDPIGVTIADADENVTVENAPVAVGGVVVERPDIALEKTADPAIANVGDTVTYTYTITNTGETTLSDLVLVDDKLGAILLTDVVLQPGDSTEVEETHVVTESDAEAGEIVNVAVVTGRAPSGEEVTAEDAAEVAVVAVEGVTLTRPAPEAAEQEQAPETQPEQLARTGAHTGWMLLLALIGLIGGTAFLRVADRREEVRA